MQEEWHVSTPRDNRRSAIFFSTPAEKLALERYEFQKVKIT